MTRSDSNYSFWLLNAAAYVTLGAVALGALPQIPAGPRRLVAVAAFLLFGVLLALFLQLEERPRLVHGYLAVQTAVTAAIIFREPQTATHSQTLFFILAAQSMLFLPVRAAVPWIVAFSAITVGGYEYFFGLRENLGILTVVGGYLFFGTFGAALKQANEARQESQRLLQELQAANAQLRAYTQQAEQLAVSEERNRLAREMHDALGHRLTVAVVQLEGARRLIPDDPQRAAAIVETMRAQLKEALAELRRTVAALRGPRDEESAPQSLLTAVSDLTHTFREATGLQVHLSIPDELPVLPVAHRRALFRAAQEALTNVQRHANASQAWLTITATDDVQLTVCDDGAGLPDQPADGRFGLQGLRERAEKLGGDLTLGHGAHGGAQVTFTLPLSSVSTPREPVHA